MAQEYFRARNQQPVLTLGITVTRANGRTGNLKYWREAILMLKRMPTAVVAVLGIPLTIRNQRLAVLPAL